MAMILSVGRLLMGLCCIVQVDAEAVIKITPINDAPFVNIVEVRDANPKNDTLKYELGSEEPVFFTTLFEAGDADGDKHCKRR
jgi:hypothetical protein